MTLVDDLSVDWASIGRPQLEARRVADPRPQAAGAGVETPVTVPTVECGLRAVVFCSIRVLRPQSLDRFHVRLLHLPQNGRVRAQPLYVSPLPLG